MRRLLIGGLMITCLLIPLMDKPQSAHLRSECVEKIDFKIFRNKYLIVEEEYKMQKEIQRQTEEQERLKNKELERQRLDEKQIEDDNKIYCTFEVSFYCGCYDCTQNGNGLTASGEYAQEGITIAMPSDIPFGSEVYIEELDNTYITQDRGGYIANTYDEYGNKLIRVDIYLESHDECYEKGRYYSDGWIKIKE